LEPSPGWSDARLRSQALFEVTAEGTLGLAIGDSARERRFVFVFDVVQPKSELMLDVYPEIPGPSMRRARGDVTVAVQVIDSDVTPLVADERVHTGRVRGLQWGSQRDPFTPRRTGPAHPRPPRRHPDAPRASAPALRRLTAWVIINHAMVDHQPQREPRRGRRVHGVDEAVSTIKASLEVASPTPSSPAHP
jgi:hypothetical protein